MKRLPDSVLGLLEPALYAVRQGTPAEVQSVLNGVDSARRAAAVTGEALHRPSFEAGSLETLREVLNTSLHRARLNAVVDGVRASQRGLDVLRAAARARVLGRDLPQKALASEIGMNEGNFSRLASRLVELGVLEAMRNGPISILSPTPLGEMALDELLAGWRASAPLMNEAAVRIPFAEPFRDSVQPSAQSQFRNDAHAPRAVAQERGGARDRLRTGVFDQIDSAVASQ